jgi:1-acyl-sn-glycerol-3-phosphate acyltransferase
MLDRFLKRAFFLLIVKPVVFIGLGLNIWHRERLPQSGPAIIAANHNSHLDTLVLMALYPLRDLPRLRPVAAADYFMRNRFLAWFALKVIGIIPLDRKGDTARDALFAACEQALAAGQILLLFPEGGRGDPERLQPLKRGIFYLAKSGQGVGVTAVVMHGLGRAMPKGDALIVPFNCDVVIGETYYPEDDAQAFIEELGRAFESLLALCLTRRHAGDGDTDELDVTNSAAASAEDARIEDKD